MRRESSLRRQPERAERPPGPCLLHQLQQILVELLRLHGLCEAHDQPGLHDLPDVIAEGTGRQGIEGHHAGIGSGQCTAGLRGPDALHLR